MMKVDDYCRMKIYSKCIFVDSKDKHFINVTHWVTDRLHYYVNSLEILLGTLLSSIWGTNYYPLLYEERYLLSRIWSCIVRRVN